ncbi:hypothetical protein GIY30_02155 [Gordonia sp. HNM0687]|uniref:RES domain-containing protein n=1 Tax=Gordonia mangrovi TaxID=2665643 RepID=A0A6L7GJU4_9ACTN|nr:hypothetical protein [Gordonia mangrovi]MXP20174.1 hypothetical protein [Gordonia mangrovi]UVF79219.1 hypothetical protein NWF22_05085 [Gordonia mangrovi]
MTDDRWHGRALQDEPAVRISYVKAGPLAWPEWPYIGSGRWDDPNGRFLEVGHPTTLASLHREFGGYAVSCGLAEGVDLSAITSAAREFTQHLSGALYRELRFSSYPRDLDGIEYPSRHGIGSRLWALYERPDRKLRDRARLETAGVCLDSDPDLIMAMDLHHLRWATP